MAPSAADYSLSGLYAPIGTRDRAATCTWSRRHISPASSAAPETNQPAEGKEPGELARQPGHDALEALRSLIDQVSELQSDNDRLRGDNDRLSAEIERMRALMRGVGGEIARRANELLTEIQD